MLLVCALWVLWCGAAAVTEALIARELLVFAAHEAENMAAEGITQGYDAMSWSRGLASNVSLLLLSFDELLGNMSQVNDAVSSLRKLPVKKRAQLAMTNLEWKAKSARAATLKMRNMRGTTSSERSKIVRMQEVDIRAEEAKEAANTWIDMKQIAGAAQELKRAAEQAEESWRLTVQRATLQLAAAGEVIEAVKSAREETLKVETVLRDEGEDARKAKDVIKRVKPLLEASLRKAMRLKVTAQTLIGKAEYAKRAYRGAVAKAAALENHIFEEEAKKKAAEAKRKAEEEEAKRKAKEEEAKKKAKEEEERRKAEEEEAKRRADGSKVTASVFVSFVVFFLRAWPLWQ